MNESMEKRCPLTGHPCDQDCAWKRRKECAVWVLAGEAFALTEAFMVVHRLTPIGESHKKEDDEQ